jgi:uncharacterized protein YndB with AHSA1/START domain
MKTTSKNLEFKFERTIQASPDTVYKAWLNPKLPGNPWNMADKLLLNPEVDGFFYWLVDGVAHYGRFTDVKPAGRIRHTWVSPNTLGKESIITVTFRKKGAGTLMTLVHSDLPNTKEARSHENGWNYFLDLFPKQFAS